MGNSRVIFRNMSSATRRRLHFACRTSYSVSLCVFLMLGWKWSGDATYISLAITILLTTMYVGQWQSNSWKVFYASFFGSVLGIICLQFWNHKVLYTVCFFCSILWLNKCILWDQFEKIFGGLSFVIAAFSAPGNTSTRNVFISSMLMFNIPSVIVGVSLLIPPALAADSCIRKVHRIEKKLRSISAMYSYALLYPDFANMYLFEAETTTRALKPLLSTLSSYICAVEYEVFIFPQLRSLPDMLRSFLSAANQMLTELDNMRCAHSRIVFNSTHFHIISVLEPSLVESLSTAGKVLHLAAYTFLSVSNGLWYKKLWTKGLNIDSVILTCCTWPRCRVCLQRCHKSREPLEHDDVEITYDSHNSSSKSYISVLMSISDRERTNSVDGKEGTPDKNADDNLMFNGRSGDILAESRSEDILKALRTESLNLGRLQKVVKKEVKTARERYLFCTDMNSKEHDLAPGDKVASQVTVNQESSNAKSVIRKEYLSLGVKNLVPRGSFVLHFLFYMNELRLLETNLATAFYSSEPNKTPPLFIQILMFIQSSLGVVLKYFTSCFTSVIKRLSELIKSYLAPGSSENRSNAFLKRYLVDLHPHYLQPLKIALAGTLCALLVIVPKWRRSNPFGAWAAVVVMIVRQDSSSSSYLRGYQRLEGTVIGSVFSFALVRMTRGFRTQQQENTVLFTICFLIWVGLCAYYREVPIHGYSAAVAALTPVILVLGNPNDPDLESVAWNRVSMTFYGVLVYLFIDNTIYPTRSDSLIRASTSGVIYDIRKTVVLCKEALEQLFYVDDQSNRNHICNSEAKKCNDRIVNEAINVEDNNQSDVIINVTRSLEEWPSNTSEYGENTTDSPVTSTQESYLSLRRYARCRHLIQDEVIAIISGVRRNIAKREENLSLAAFEPKLWHKEFPLTTHQCLHSAMTKVLPCLAAVSSSTLFMCTTLAGIPICSSETRDIAQENLSLVGGMSSLLLEVSETAEEALGKVAENISRY